MIKNSVFGLALAALIMLPAAARADDALTKLGRGAANTLTGWVEIPKNVYNTSKESDTLSGMTLGLAKGIGMGIVRTGSGIFEIVTFPFAVPKDYKPLLEPEYVFES